MSYFRQAIDAMSAYQPGEQPPLGSSVIKLNSNENPYPPSPKVLDALHQIDGEMLRRYPNATAQPFRQAVSQVLDVPPDWVLVGNGSDEILATVIRACTGGDRRVAYPTPTYVLYRTLVQIQDAVLVEIPHKPGWNLPVDELIQTAAAVTFIASPNSPLGLAVPLPDLDRLAANLSGILVIDEAYVDFAEADALALVHRYPNVLILRTLSKGYSLAGLRLGFAIAQPQLLAGLYKVKDSYNVDAIACLLGTAAISDQDYKTANAQRIKASRLMLRHSLKRLGFEVMPSYTNFLLARPPQGDAERLYKALKERGVLVRYFKQPGLDDKLRISVGSDDQNQVLEHLLSVLVRAPDDI
jgi:histidinol-phosphate aminotransferase